MGFPRKRPAAVGFGFAALSALALVLRAETPPEVVEDFAAAGNPYEDRAFPLASPGNGRAVWNGNIDGVPVAGAPAGSLEAAYGEAAREVAFTTTVNWVSAPWYSLNARSQNLYSPGAMGNTPRTLSGFRWRLRPGNTLALGTYTAVKVNLGHNASGSLDPTYADSFADAPAEVSDADYVLAAGMDDQGWVAGPAFSTTFPYDGVRNLVLDIEVPVSGGPYNQMPLTDTSNAGTEYQYSVGAAKFAYQGKNLDMRFLHLVDTSEAQSKWYDTGADHPSFLDPIVVADRPAGTDIVLTWQGARPDPADPSMADPASLSAWTSTPFLELYGYRFLRWHAEMRSDLGSGAKPRIDSIEAPFIPFDSPVNVPVVLVHGNPGSPGSFGPMVGDLPLLGLFLLGRGHVVPPPFDTSAVEPADWKIRELAGRLHDHIQLVLAAAGGATRVDVVAHSTGGLVARAYMGGLAVDGQGDPIPYPDSIRRLVLAGTPNFGAPRGAIVRSLVRIPGLAEFRGEELRTCGPFLWDLHDAGITRPEDILCVVGVLPGDDDDNAVLMSSAALPAEDPYGVEVRYLPLKHSPAARPKGWGSLAFVDAVDHGLPGIVEDFLEGRTVRVELPLPPERDRSTLVLVRAVDSAGPGKAMPRSIAVDGKRYGPAFRDSGTHSAAFLVRRRSGSEGDHEVRIRLSGGYVQPDPVIIGPMVGRPVVLTVDAVRE